MLQEKHFNHKKFRELRLKNKKGQYQVAFDIGVEQSVISRLENGQITHPRLDLLSKIVDYFNCQYEDLIIIIEL